jgi:hypothetical protein
LNTTAKEAVALAEQRAMTYGFNEPGQQGDDLLTQVAGLMANPAVQELVKGVLAGREQSAKAEGFPARSESVPGESAAGVRTG